MKRIFLDVGAHTGETLHLLKGLPFDRIVAFEPAPSPALRKMAEEVGAEVIEAGLLNETCERPLLYAGSVAASIYRDKQFYPIFCAGGSPEPTPCRFLSASKWIFDNVPVGSLCLMKLNCEGAEIPILDSLLDSGEIERVTSIVLDWDCEKVASLRGASSRMRRLLGSRVWAEDWSEAQKIPGLVGDWLRYVEEQWEAADLANRRAAG